MSGQSPFAPRVLVALGAALVALFAASLLLTGAGGNRSAGNPIGPNTYSRSAVGHLGLFDVLQKLGYRAVRNEQNTLPMLGTDGVLVLAEPAGGFFGAEDKRKLLGAPAVLLVLPKWSVDRSEEHDGWIGAATLAPQSLAQLALNAIAGPGKVVQVAKPSAFVKSLVVPDPSVEAPIQLIANSKMRPLVATSDGILLGEFREGLRRVWVLADPDPIENHGSARATISPL